MTHSYRAALGERLMPQMEEVAPKNMTSSSPGAELVLVPTPVLLPKLTDFWLWRTQMSWRD